MLFRSGDIRNPGKAPNGLAGREVLPDQVSDIHKPLVFQHEGIRPGEEDPPDRFRPGDPPQAGRQHGKWVRTPQLRFL